MEIWQREMTDFFLARLGMRVTNGPQNEIPTFVWLSRAQREFITQVNKHGYGAKLG